MVKTFDLKIKELEKEKSELDLDFLQFKKQEYEQRISELLVNPLHEWEGEYAIAKFNEVRECHAEIILINHNIQHNSEILEEIDKKIRFYKERRERVKNIPLYKDTEQWIAEIFLKNPKDLDKEDAEYVDELYGYAKETNNMELINKFETRTLTEKEYTELSERMYKDLFGSILDEESNEKQPHKRTRISLPEWMSEQINKDLKDDNNLSPQDIERFLKNELKKNAWEIKISHIKNTFKDKSDQAYNYIMRIIASYPKFKISDKPRKDDLTVSTQSKREKLISQTTNQSDKKRNEESEKRRLLSKLGDIWTNEKLEDRVRLYVNLYEEIWCKFTDWVSFSNDLFRAINTYNHIDLEWEIQKNLTNIINGLRPAKLEKFWYFAYKFGRSWDNWRIILYPNGEIFTICSHADYEKIIGTKPPVDKTK